MALKHFLLQQLQLLTLIVNLILMSLIILWKSLLNPETPCVGDKDLLMGRKDSRKLFPQFCQICTCILQISIYYIDIL